MALMTNATVTCSLSRSKKQNLQTVYAELLRTDTEVAALFWQRVERYPEATTDVLAGQFLHVRWVD